MQTYRIRKFVVKGEIDPDDISYFLENLSDFVDLFEKIVKVDLDLVRVVPANLINTVQNADGNTRISLSKRFVRGVT